MKIKELQLFIDNVLDNFTTKKITSKEIFKDFVCYFYFIMDDKINSTKKESIKNKYIMIRQSVIRYIVANEKAITSKICRNRRNK
jgi:hypothetical protein